MVDIEQVMVRLQSGSEVRVQSFGAASENAQPIVVVAPGSSAEDWIEFASLLTSSHSPVIADELGHAAASDVEADRQIRILRGGPDRIPVGVVQRRLPEVLGLAGEQHRLVTEQCTAREMIKLSRVFLRVGISHLNMMFHSTSLMHGLTPFNRNSAEEKRLFQRIDDYLKYVSDQKIESSTLSQFATNLR